VSKAVLNAILNEMQIWLNENEREQLYHELTAYFGAQQTSAKPSKTHGKAHVLSVK